MHLKSENPITSWRPIFRCIVLTFLPLSACQEQFTPPSEPHLKQEYHDNGILSAEGYFDANEMPVIVQRKYFPNGRIKSEISLKAGKLHGLCTTFYETGAPKSCSMYVSGVKQGQSVWYYENGLIEQVTKHLDTNEVGTSLFFYPNGSIRTLALTDSSGTCLYVHRRDSLGRILVNEGIVSPSPIDSIYLNRHF